MTYVKLRIERVGLNAVVWRVFVLVSLGVGSAIYLLGPRKKMEHDLYGGRHSREVVDR